MKKITTVDTMTLDGGVECLDFINSGYDDEKGVVMERLHSYSDLLTLAKRIHLLDESGLNDLKKRALSGKKEADAAMGSARKVRSLLYRLFTAVAEQSPEMLKQDLLAALDSMFAEALRFRTLTVVGGNVQLSFISESAGLMAPVWQVVLSAYDLLNSGNLQFLRQCKGCAWLFVDKTKNHRRKWCSMESCGNGQKTRRYYLKKKSV